MSRFIDSIAVAARSGRIDHIVVYGYASPDGLFRNNGKLSIERCNAIADYISRQAGIPLSYIHTSPGGVAWDGLRTLVIENKRTPHRDTILQILNKYLPEACTNQSLSDQCLNSLLAIDEGRPYYWMLDNLFPKLRFALAIYTYSATDSSIAHTNSEDDTESVSELISAGDDASTIPYSTELGPSYRPIHRLAVKTNLLYDAVLVPNIEVEWRFNRNWSVALEGGCTSVGKYDNGGNAYRLSMISPEVKRWIRSRAPWHGLYVGLFAGGALYDFEKRNRGYYGNGVMGGLSVGYMWPVSRCLSLEAAIGAGYLRTRYKEYVPLEGHHVYQRTKDLNYFGPLKVKFSLVWRLWDLNKPQRLSPENQSIMHDEK